MTRRKSTPTAATTPLLARALRGDGRACTRECVCARSQADILRSTFAFRDSLVDSHACSVACELASHNPSRCVRPRTSPSSSAAPWVDISTKFLTVARLCTACRRRTSEICRGRHRPNRVARMQRAEQHDLERYTPGGRPWLRNAWRRYRARPHCARGTCSAFTACASRAGWAVQPPRDVQPCAAGNEAAACTCLSHWQSTAHRHECSRLQTRRRRSAMR